MRTRLGTLRILLVALCIMPLAACGGDEGSAANSPGPGQQLQAAASAMRTVKAFRFTAEVVSGSQQIQISGEFSAPNNLHEHVQIGSRTLELIRVGSRTYSRDTATAPWQPATGSGPSVPTDPRSAFNALTAVTGVTVAGSTYAFTLTNGAAAQLVQGTNSVTGTATLDGGRIADLKYAATSPPISVHLTYRDFNTAPAVTLPTGL